MYFLTSGIRKLGNLEKCLLIIEIVKLLISHISGFYWVNSINSNLLPQGSLKKQRFRPSIKDE